MPRLSRWLAVLSAEKSQTYEITLGQVLFPVNTDWPGLYSLKKYHLQGFEALKPPYRD